MIFLEVDPNVVKPGWTPLIITIVLAAVIALLMISMRRQMRKIDVPYRADIADDDDSDADRMGDPDQTAGADTPSEVDAADPSGNGKRVGHSG